MKHAYIAVILALLGNSIFTAQPISHTETKQLSEISCNCRDNEWGSPCHINVALGQEDALVEELNELLTSRIETYYSHEAVCIKKRYSFYLKRKVVLSKGFLIKHKKRWVR